MTIIIRLNNFNLVDLARSLSEILHCQDSTLLFADPEFKCDNCHELKGTGTKDNKIIKDGSFFYLKQIEDKYLKC